MYYDIMWRQEDVRKVHPLFPLVNREKMLLQVIISSLSGANERESVIFVPGKSIET